MEIQFIHAKEMDHKLLIDHIQRMASGEAPFFPTTLSLVYDKLLEKAFTKHTPFGSGPGDCTEGKSPTHPIPPSQATTSSSSITSSFVIGPAASSSNLQPRSSTRGPVPLITTAKLGQLKCVRCGEVAPLRDLYGGLYCPRCQKSCRSVRRAFMQCRSCGIWRTMQRGDCCKGGCGRRFM